MVAIHSPTQQLSLEDFLKLPETKPAREYIEGEIHQKPMPQGEHSTIQIELASAINEVGKPKKLVYALPELRCTFGGHSIVPDIAVFEWNRIPKTDKGRIANRFEIPPDWIIEILSPSQSTNKVMKKILFCLSQGTQLGWLVDPEDESVMIIKPNSLPEIKSTGEVLPVIEVLETWQLTVDEMFAWLRV